jgi:hypothetical protein
MTPILRPIKGEEWIEKFRATEFWIAKKRSYPQKLYARMCKSYLGWWCYFRLHSIWHRATLLIDPLSSGGFYSHLRTFLWNLTFVDIVWPLKRAIWKRFHRKEWEQRRRFMRAALQAMSEGYDDPMPPPPGFEGMNFQGSILGERYFKRMAEILKHENEATE